MVMKLQEVEPLHSALQAPVSALLNDCMDGITLVHSYRFFFYEVFIMHVMIYI